ncbi:MAG: hypothetical protein IJF43_03145 [Firmicutes bacterium]|nr:hypothetical protein [Bacillota bacterium]MBQ4092727.1 hypothetical protein [Bacillota bacterium]
MIREDLLERLKGLDEEAALLFDTDRRFRIVIVGGSALILLKVIPRATMDIDALRVSGELMGLIEKYDINCNVKAFEDQFPYNYEDRLQKLPIDGEVIDFYTASLEDIVAAKLYSNRDTDRQDIISEEVLAKLDWKLLDHLATAEDEVKASILNPRRYRDFLANYEEYKRRFCPCGN